MSYRLLSPFFAEPLTSPASSAVQGKGSQAARTDPGSWLCTDTFNAIQPTLTKHPPFPGLHEEPECLRPGCL